MDRAMNILISGGLILLCYIIVLGLIFLDLWAGVRKAKKRGEYRTSDGYKRTIDKIRRYYNMMLAVSLVDVLQIALLFYLHWGYNYDIPMLPIFTFVGATYIAFVEIKSIREPADIKEKKQQDDFRRMAINIVKDHNNPQLVLQDVIDALTDAQNQQREREEEDDDEEKPGKK